MVRIVSLSPWKRRLIGAGDDVSLVVAFISGLLDYFYGHEA